MTRPRRGATVVVNDATESRSAHARSVARGFAQRLESTPVGVLWSRLLEVEFVDRSVALAAKLFVSFFPLLIVAAAVARDGVHQAIVAAVMDRLGVSGEALDMVQQAFATPEATKAATGILGGCSPWPMPCRSPPRCSACTCGRGGVHPAGGCGTRAAARSGWAVSWSTSSCSPRCGI